MIIPLKQAYLCLDCESIGDSANGCTSCLSSAVYSLAKFIDRATDDNSLVLSRSLGHTCDNPRVPCIACNLASVI
jgi:hypothetical protein